MTNYSQREEDAVMSGVSSDLGDKGDDVAASLKVTPKHEQIASLRINKVQHHSAVLIIKASLNKIRWFNRKARAVVFSPIVDMQMRKRVPFLLVHLQLKGTSRDDEELHHVRIGNLPLSLRHIRNAKAPLQKFRQILEITHE